MRSIADIADLLDREASRIKAGKLQLAKDAGITYRTLSHVLSGTQDFKVSTLMSVADRLGLELVLMPKGAVRGVASEPPPLDVQSRVQAALARINKPT